MPPSAAPSHSTRYDLHFLIDHKRFFWKNPNCGVTLTDAGLDSCLTWQTERGETSRLWTDIVTVTMTSASDGKNEVNSCRIAFLDGRSITVTDAGASGQLDEARTGVYRDFVRALHARLALAPEGTIAFHAGMTEARYNMMVGVMVFAGLFFVGIPVALLFIVRDWRVLGVLVAGAALVWPLYRINEKNRPRRYDPKHPPGELME